MMFFAKKDKLTVKSYPRLALAVAFALICLFPATNIATFPASAENFEDIDLPTATKAQKHTEIETITTTTLQKTPQKRDESTTVLQIAPRNQGGSSALQSTPQNQGGSSALQSTPQNQGGSSALQSTPQNQGGSSALQSAPRNQGGSAAETLPEEYDVFIDSLPEDLLDTLPEDLLSGRVDSLSHAAREMSGAGYILGNLSEAFGLALAESLPTLATLCGIVVLAAVAHTFGSSFGTNLASAVDFAARLCTYSAIAVVSVGVAERLEVYFSRLLAAVGGFLPLSAALYAMGGNFTSAVSGSAALSATLTVCELFLCKSVVPVFCICLSLSLLQAFEGGGALSAQSVSATLKKWYTTALGFIMALLTTAVAAQSIISTKADNAAMRGVKFAAGSFIPVSGGTIATTLSTLSSSVELLRGSVGVVGIVVILLLLLPVVVELAIMRGVISLAAFLSGMLGCGGEQKLLNEVGALYGYLEGIAALSAVVFIIAFGIFATTAAAV